MQIVSWFFNKVPGFVCLALCIVVSLTVATLVHIQTKESYRAVGFNDGSIHAKRFMIETIKNTVDDIYNCKDLDGSSNPVEILSVKTKSLFLVKSEDGRIEFCLWE
jgi:hypothetical protein